MQLYLGVCLETASWLGFAVFMAAKLMLVCAADERREGCSFKYSNMQLRALPAPTPRTRPAVSPSLGFRVCGNPNPNPKLLLLF